MLCVKELCVRVARDNVVCVRVVCDNVVCENVVPVRFVCVARYNTRFFYE